MRSSVQNQIIELATRECEALSTIQALPAEARSALGLDAILRGAGIESAEGKREKPATVKVVNQNETTVEVRIDGYIHLGVLYNLRYAMESAEKPPEKMVVRINSGGGSAYAGYGIFNYLRTLKAKVVTVADGLAASAAALIYLSGDERLIAPNLAQIMFHRAMSFIDILAFGNQTELEKVDCEKPKMRVLQVLKAIDEDILEVIVDKSGMDEEKALEIVENETFLTRKQALKLGVATGVDETPTSGGDHGKEKDSAETASEQETNPVADANQGTEADAKLEPEAKPEDTETPIQETLLEQEQPEAEAQEASTQNVTPSPVEPETKDGQPSEKGSKDPEDSAEAEAKASLAVAQEAMAGIDFAVVVDCI